MRTTWLVIAALALAACEGASLPMSSVEADSAGKRFEPPAPGMAALYVYRTRAGNDATMTAGQRTLGTLQGRTWLRVDLPPGRQDVRCSIPAWPTINSLDVDLQAGDIVTVSATEAVTSMWSAACLLVNEPAGVAYPAIRAGARIKEVR